MVVRVFNRVVDHGQPSAIDALRAELDLLREENARLRLEPYRPTIAAPNLSGLVDARPSEPAGTVGAADLVRLRAMAADATDAAWQGLSDALAVRDALMSMCTDIAMIASQLRERLALLTPFVTTSVEVES